MPHSVEAEQALVGSVLINPGIYGAIQVAASDFFLDRHKWIWDSFGRLYGSDTTIDLLTVSEDLKNNNQLKDVGGLAYLSSLLQHTPSSMHAEDYAKTVVDLSRRRSLISLAGRMVTAAMDTKASIEQSTPAMIDSLVGTIRVSGSAVHFASALQSTVDEVFERNKNPQDIWGVRTGYTDFDNATGGLHPGEVLYLSGMPGVGKSIIAMQAGLQMAQGGYPGVIYSLEMPANQVIRRWLSYLTKIPTRSLKSGRIAGAEFTLLGDAVQNTEHIPLYMSDSPDWTTVSLRADLSRLKATYNIEWFVLDYAYLLKDMPGVSENERSGFVSAQLKSICRALDLAGIVVHSLRKSEGDPDLMDLRGSGQQAYDSDLVVMVTKDKQNPNLLKCYFRKGRELENIDIGFELIKLDRVPAVGNAVKIDVNKLVEQYDRQESMNWTDH